ncbi:cytochrome c biogenesis CcdA family protein [Tranquillimonas alkanivorans]|uniref:Cytochrome c-type biogenesis protein n=1 Tax=Tranquillimonas alkanivorans TaxID=441119 RepID=A0A1I5VZP9_9RHOB|nr:cytochrome c biogenesis CcdA family protein [Tranquillimonas alkanivorans]SFQ12900.1 cytochrome c-type biogenesis protein [Tranquillimonas alkanivorans]
MLDATSLGAIAALAAGAISFVSPCVLPLVPGYASYIAGRTGPGGRPGPRWGAVWLSFCFVLGFFTIFMVLGASATALGQALLRWRYELNLLGGAIVILFGLFILGAARIQMMERDLRFHLDLPGGRAVASYVLGLAFGFGWTPCIGPILGAILTASAASATISEGVTLLAMYSAGLGVPFLVVAAFTDRIAGRIRAIGRIGRRLHQGAGLVMIVTELAMMTGRLSAFSWWLLEAFPVLGRIG